MCIDIHLPLRYANVAAVWSLGEKRGYLNRIDFAGRLRGIAIRGSFFARALWLALLDECDASGPALSV